MRCACWSASVWGGAPGTIRSISRAGSSSAWRWREPCNLDGATGAAVIDLMFDLNAEQGTTLVLVTHDEALARRCDRVLKLREGRLAEDPAHAAG